MKALRRARLAVIGLVAAIAATGLAACKPRSTAEAERKHDITWLAESGTPESVAALGRIADTDPKAVTALDARASHDVNVYIAAWTAVTRNGAWGTTFLKSALADPTRAEMAASALPRRDPRLAPFVNELDGAVVRLSAGRRGSVVAGILASMGPPAHAVVEKRLLDAKTRGSMCDGIALPEASGDAKSTLLAVPAEGRDHPACVGAVLAMASNEDPVLDWLAARAEPGLLSAVAKSDMPCARLVNVWKRGLTERAPETHAALTVPLQLSLRRCAVVLDPILGDLLTKAPGSRACIVQAIDPYGAELRDLKATCKALGAGWANGEHPRVRERAHDALNHGCQFAK
jgi:hypothetical protein